MEINKQYLSVEEMSIFLKCTPQYTRKLIRDGKIKAEQVGKTWVINSSVLDEYETIFKFCKNVPDQIRKSDEIPNIVALSFFSGAMGLDYGIEKVGIHPLLASEIRRFANLSENQEIDLVIGGPPCQAFSTAGQRKGFQY